MNKTFLMGRLTKDPEIRYSQGANPTAIAGFSIAVDRKFKREGEPDADFFNCTAFGKTAEFFEKYVKKGVKVIVEGRLQNETYEKDGQKRTVTKIMVEQAEFAESKKASEENASSGDSGQKNAQSAPEGFMEIPDDLGSEIPFN